MQGTRPSLSIWISGVALIGVVLSIVISFAKDWSNASIGPSLQISLVIIALICVLGLLATVASAIGIGDRSEAFGLPSGSIRAVLSLGLLVAFVIFGLSQAERLSQPQFLEDTIEVTWSEIGKNEPNSQPNPSLLTAKLNQIAALGLVHKRQDFAANPAKFIVLKPLSNSELVSFGKEIMTTLGTLLASILSFYFGARAVEAGAKSSKDTTAAALPSVREAITVKSKGISFEAPDIIKDSNNGLSAFRDGDTITVSGSTDQMNDKQFIIKTVSAGDKIIVLEQTVVASAVSDNEVTLKTS